MWRRTAAEYLPRSGAQLSCRCWRAFAHPQRQLFEAATSFAPALQLWEMSQTGPGAFFIELIDASADRHFNRDMAW
jgi:hypothetical protein